MPVELAWTTWGNSNKHTILLIHGAASSGRMWQPIAESLADQYHLIAPDLRGHGASPRPGAYPPEELAADLAAFIAGHISGRFAIVGHSIGALLAVDYTIRHPERVSSLISIDINVPLPEWQKDYIRRVVDKPVRVFATRGDGLAFLRRALLPTASGELLEAFAGCVLAEGPSGWTFNFDAQVLRQFAALDSRFELERIECPTLFLRGSESPVMDRANGIAMLHRVAHSSLVQIPRAGHYPFLDNPTATTDELRRFLSVVDRGP